MDCSPPGAFVCGISRQEYWSGFPFSSPGDLPGSGTKPVSPALAGRVTTLSHWGSSDFCCCLITAEYGSVKKFSCLGLGHSFYARIYKCISFRTHRGFCLDSSLVSRTGLVGSCTNHAARGHSRTVLGPAVSKSKFLKYLESGGVRKG